jgi:hypothetical protein
LGGPVSEEEALFRCHKICGTIRALDGNRRQDLPVMADSNHGAHLRSPEEPVPMTEAEPKTVASFGESKPWGDADVQEA